MVLVPLSIDLDDRGSFDLFGRHRPSPPAGKGPQGFQRRTRIMEQADLEAMAAGAMKRLAKAPVKRIEVRGLRELPAVLGRVGVYGRSQKTERPPSHHDLPLDQLRLEVERSDRKRIAPGCRGERLEPGFEPRLVPEPVHASHLTQPEEATEGQG